MKLNAERRPNTSKTSGTQRCHCDFQQFSYFFSIFLESLKQFQFSCGASQAKRSENIFREKKEKELINFEVELDWPSFTTKNLELRVQFEAPMERIVREVEVEKKNLL